MPNRRTEPPYFQPSYFRSRAAGKSGSPFGRIVVECLRTGGAALMQNPEDGQNREAPWTPFAFHAADANNPTAFGGSQRLDALLPQDAETGVVSTKALRSYLHAMMEMADRYGQPLALLAVAVD